MWAIRKFLLRFDLISLWVANLYQALSELHILSFSTRHLFVFSIRLNNNNNLLISRAQVSTIRFSNARYILDRDKHDVYNTLYWQLPTRGFSVTIYNSTGNQIDIAQIAIYNYFLQIKSNVGFWWEGKTGVPGEKPLIAE